MENSMENSIKAEVKKFDLSNRLFILTVILVISILLNFFVGHFLNFLFNPTRYQIINISAEGKVLASPDLALLNLGIKTEGKTVEAVFKENTEKMNALLFEIKNLGIKENDIQTINYQLTPNYEWIDGKSVLKGYLLEQQVRVKIRDFEKIGKIIEKATEKGANLIGNLSFTIDNPEALKAKAREEAIKKAKEKAKEISRQTGLKLGKIINMYENEYPSPPPVYFSDIRVPTNPTINNEPNLQPGELEIKSEITLIYQVR